MAPLLGRVRLLSTFIVFSAYFYRLTFYNPAATMHVSLDQLLRKEEDLDSNLVLKAFLEKRLNSRKSPTYSEMLKQLQSIQQEQQQETIQDSSNGDLTDSLDKIRNTKDTTTTANLISVQQNLDNFSIPAGNTDGNINNELNQPEIINTNVELEKTQVTLERPFQQLDRSDSSNDLNNDKSLAENTQTSYTRATINTQSDAFLISSKFDNIVSKDRFFYDYNSTNSKTTDTVNADTNNTVTDSDVVVKYYYPHQIPLDPNRKTRQRFNGGGAFIHVGKTGGSTLTRRIRNACHSFIPKPCGNARPHNESALSLQIKSYYHAPDFDLLPRSRHDFYFITVRDPYQRFVSAYKYDHIDNRMARGGAFVRRQDLPALKEAYHKCLPTLETFVSHLDCKENDSVDNYHYPYNFNEIVTTSCRDYARAAFDGKVDALNHVRYGYKTLKALMPQTSDSYNYTIYVDRQDYLWQDWVHINTMLGDNITTVWTPSKSSADFSVRNVTAQYMPVDGKLSERGKSILCKALAKEYESYFWFLRRAKNIHQADIEEAQEFANRLCPKEAKI